MKKYAHSDVYAPKMSILEDALKVSCEQSLLRSS